MATSGAGDGTTEPTTTETAPNDAPWTADLRGLGLDDETFGKVDGYMREKVQPHTTQLEQTVSELRENGVPEGIQQFLSDLGEDPDTALKQLASEVYSDNPEAAEIFEVAIKYANGNPDATTEEAVQAATQHVEQGGTADEFDVELDDEDRERLDFVDTIRDQQEDAEYRSALNELKKDNPNDFPAQWTEEQLDKVMGPLLVAAPEDLDDEQAMEWAFERYKDTRQLIHGGDPGTEGAAAEAAGNLSPAQVEAINAGAGAPAVITGGQNASVPAQKQYDSIGEAVADFGRELAAKNNAPPVV